MEEVILATGSMTYNKDLDGKFGQTDPNTKEIMSKERNKERVSLAGVMDPSISVSSMQTTFTVKGFINGVMVECIMVIDNLMKCMDKDFLLGKMANHIQANLKTIKNTDKELLRKRTAHNIEVNGLMIWHMA